MTLSICFCKPPEVASPELVYNTSVITGKAFFHAAKQCLFNIAARCLSRQSRKGC